MTWANQRIGADRALAILCGNPALDLYMCADYRSWAITHGHGLVPSEVVDELLRAGKLARRWAEMPCYYWSGDTSVEKVVRARDEVHIPAVRDSSLDEAMRDYMSFELARELERSNRKRKLGRAVAAELEG